MLCGRLGTIEKLNLPAAKKAKIEEAANTIKPSKYDTAPVVPSQANKPALTKPKKDVEKSTEQQQTHNKPGNAPAATKLDNFED